MCVSYLEEWPVTFLFHTCVMTIKKRLLGILIFISRRTFQENIEWLTSTKWYLDNVCSRTKNHLTFKESIELPWIASRKQSIVNSFIRILFTCIIFKEIAKQKGYSHVYSFQQFNAIQIFFKIFILIWFYNIFITRTKMLQKKAETFK